MTTPDSAPVSGGAPLPNVVAGLTGLRAVARGGYSTVYRAWQESVGREVALKVDLRTLDEERDRRRFLREAQAAGRMSGHPHIVHVYDAGVTPDGHPYLVMELCTGGSYASKLKSGERLSVAHVRDVGIKIADALDAAHRTGILHRDVKPANILINRYGIPGLADFGLAAVHDASRDTSVTVESLTPAYAAPEVFRLERPTRAGDIYSLAATLYALLSGRPPRWPEHGSPSPVQLVALHNQPLPRLPQIPEQLYLVLAKAMATNPADRYESAAAFRDALVAVSPDSTAVAPPSSPPMQQPPQQQPSVVAVSAPPASWQHSQTYPPHTFAERIASAPPAVNSAPKRPKRSKRQLVLLGVLLLLLAAVVAGGTVATLQRSEDAASESKVDNSSCPIETKLAACVTKPECFTEAGRDNTDFGAAAPIDCGQPHNWETFVIAQLPSSVQYPTYEQLRNNPYVVAMCSKETLGRLLDSTSSWQISLLPPTKADVDAATTPEKRENLRFRCVAGKTKAQDSSAFARR